MDTKLRTVELDVCDSARALSLLSDCHDKGLQTYESAELAVSESSFGLMRSEQDFVEFYCNGEDEITVRSDRTVFPSLWAKLLTPRRRIELVATLSDAARIIGDYFQLDRPQFESKYEAHYCR